MKTLRMQCYTHTLTICNIFCFYTAKMLARTRLDVTLYVHSWSRLVLPSLSSFHSYSDLSYLLIVDIEGYCCTLQLTFMLPAGFEPVIPAGERPQTYKLDGAATGTGFS